MDNFEHLGEYKVLREKWVHEDNVINHRMEWLIFSQAMLLAVYGWSLAANQPKTQKLVTLIPIFGMIFTIAIGISIVVAVIAQHSLLDHQAAKNWEKPYSVDTYRPVNWLGRIAALALPVFLFIIWLVVGIA